MKKIISVILILVLLLSVCGCNNADTTSGKDVPTDNIIGVTYKEIEKSLEGKTINGLGKIEGGDFDLNFLTEEIGAYEQSFWITAYE